jgi:hypothetical protein
MGGYGVVDYLIGDPTSHFNFHFGFVIVSEQPDLEHGHLFKIRQKCRIDI